MGDAEIDVELCASGETVVDDSLEDFETFVGLGTLFEAISRTCSKILEVSGVTGGFEGGVATGFVSDFAGGGLGGASDFEAVFAGDLAGLDGLTDVFAAIGVVFAAFGAAFVDFALVVDFFDSGRSISIGSEMIFLGLPLFLTTSADMLYTESPLESVGLMLM